MFGTKFHVEDGAAVIFTTISVGALVVMWLAACFFLTIHFVTEATADSSILTCPTEETPKCLEMFTSTSNGKEIDHLVEVGPRVTTFYLREKKE